MDQSSNCRRVSIHLAVESECTTVDIQLVIYFYTSMLDPILCSLLWSLSGVLFPPHKVTDCYCHLEIRDLLIGVQGLVQNYSGLLACRFFLGLMEGSDIDIPGHHSLHSSASQVDSFLELFSISLISIPARGCKYGIHEIGIVVYDLTFFLGLRFSMRQHRYRAHFPVYWPLLSLSSMERVVSLGGPGYSFWHVMHQLRREITLIGLDRKAYLALFLV
jgi:hypothetical protein